MVYEFLTWEAFGPLGRMSYCLFLLHFSVMDVIFANITYPVDFGHFLGVRNQFRVQRKMSLMRFPPHMYSPRQC